MHGGYAYTGLQDLPSAGAGGYGVGAVRWLDCEEDEKKDEGAEIDVESSHG